MNCPRCDSVLPHGAGFCHRCGADQANASATSDGRGNHYAVNPSESVFSVDVVSSLMPLASHTAPRTYRLALLAGGAIPVIAVLLGWLPVAFATAALLVPVVYLVYLYDVNEWEDQPVPVVGLTVGVAGALSLGFTLLWHGNWLPEDRFLARTTDTFSAQTLLVLCVVAPIVGELLRQIGPVLLARRPAFDDMIDGVTFGVAAGVAWATVETFVLNRNLIFGGPSSISDVDASTWLISILQAGLVKPIVYGSATAIAMGAFSGVGEGYVGFGPRYLRNLLEAMTYGVVFQLGQYLAGEATGGARVLISMITGAIVAAVVVLRVRLILHRALLESALDATRAGADRKSTARGESFCGQCDMPLLDPAEFCSACGTSVRSVPKDRRRFNADASSASTSADRPVGAAS